MFGTIDKFFTENVKHKADGVVTMQLGSLYVVTQFYPPDYAPTGQLIKDIVTELGQQGNSIKVFTGQPGYVYKEQAAQSREQAGRVTVQRTRTSRLWPKRIRGKFVNGLLFAIRAAVHMFKNYKQGDILLLTTAPAFLPALGFLVKLLRPQLSYVSLIYDLYPDVVVELGAIPAHHWLARFWNWMNRCTWRNAKQIIVLSNTMKQRVINQCPEVANKISVIHNWADPDRIVPMEKQNNWFAKKHNLVEPFTVLYSGNMGLCHDMDTILEAARHLRDQPIRFVFVGDGSRRQACIDKVNEWGLDNCLFLPYQDTQTLPYSLTACDLSLVTIKAGMEGVVAPSKFYSMLASGRPIAAICESNSYLNDILTDAKCGESFENGNAAGLAQFIQKLATNPAIGKSMGRLGRYYLQSNFTLDVIVEQYATALNLQEAVNLGAGMIRPRTVQQGSKELIPLRPIGQFLQHVGLLSDTQVLEILHEQSLYRNLKFGELAVRRGWINSETMEFILSVVHQTNAESVVSVGAS
jgi:glycosyltransferase involved in cell wall biosynthesis